MLRKVIYFADQIAAVSQTHVWGPITETNRTNLLDKAQKTWKFFEDNVNASTHFLPPDFVELDENGVLTKRADRTSTTDIGEYINSIIHAMQLGFIDSKEGQERLSNTINTIETLLKTPGQSYKGHLFNWYLIEETPRVVWGDQATGTEFISTVDNGNLAACLLDAAQGLSELTGDTSEELQARILKIYDDMDFSIFYKSKALHVYGADPFTPDEFNIRLANVELNNNSKASNLIQLLIHDGKIQSGVILDYQLAYAFDQVFENPQQFLHTYMDILDEKEPGNAEALLEIRKTVKELQKRIETNLRDHSEITKKDKTQIRTMLQETFPQTFDKGLLAQGVAVQFTDSEKTEAKAVATVKNNNYNMLFSEASTAEWIAIMKKDVPIESAKNLAITIENMGVNNRAMPGISWSGSMFEFVLPALFFDYRAGSYIDDVVRRSLLEQMNVENHVLGAWGHSEVAKVVTAEDVARGFNPNDVFYASFGVRKNGLDDEFMGVPVVAGYASLMAAGYAPNEVAANARKMEELGMLTEWGFYASITDKKEIVRRIYSHHHGMALSGLAHALAGGAVTGRIERGARNPDHIIENVLTTPGTEFTTGKAQAGNAYEFDQRLSPKRDDFVGRFGKFVHADDSGWSLWGAHNYVISTNQIFYIKDQKTGKVLPLGLAKPDSTEWKDGQKIFNYSMDLGDGEKARIALKLSFSPLDTVAIWDLDIKYSGSGARSFDVFGYNEPIMNYPDRDATNPLMNDMFEKTEFLPEEGAIIAQRKTTPDEQDKQPLGFLAVKDVTGWNTDKKSFLGGRNKRLGLPDEVVNGTLGQNQGFTGNPAAVLTTQITAAEGKSAKLTFLSGSVKNQDELKRIVSDYNNPAFMKSISELQPSTSLPPDGSYTYMTEYANLADRDYTLNPGHILLPKYSFEDQGYFFSDGGTYTVIRPQATPFPYGYTHANKQGYTLTSFADRMGPSAAGNAQQNRLIPYQPDNITAPDMKGVMITDSITGKSWSLTAGTRPSVDGTYTADINPAFTKYIFRGENELAGLMITMTVFPDAENPLELWNVKVGYSGDLPLHLKIESFIKWDLAPNYPQNAHLTARKFDDDKRAHYAKTPYSINPEAVAFHAVAGVEAENGQSVFTNPKDRFEGLNFELNFDANTADTQNHYSLQKKNFAFILGQAKSEKEADALVAHYQDIDNVNKSFAARVESIEEKVSFNRVNTGNSKIDNLFNRWLPLQALQAHLWGRSGPEQSGGAFGFRDQIQTVINQLASGTEYAKSIARAHIIECAKQQLETGAVRHWWHKHNNLGILNRISDNLVWLVWAVNEYVKITGDKTILMEVAPFIILPKDISDNGELRKIDGDRVFIPKEFTKPETILEHVLRVLKRMLSHEGSSGLGEHGIPRMGTGDWNDALSKIGPKGKGESTWLGFFLHYNLVEFAGILDSLAAETTDNSAVTANYTQTAAHYRNEAAKLKDNLEKHCWETDRFIRAYKDEATLEKTDIFPKYAAYKEVLSDLFSNDIDADVLIFKDTVTKEQLERLSEKNVPADLINILIEALEGRKLKFNDAIVAAWAVISGGATDEHAETAFLTAVNALYSEKDKMIHLFDQPLPDLIDYPAGKRENMAQYTHGATWMVMAAAKLGYGDLAWKLLEALLPTIHAEMKEYGGPAYYQAADISGKSGNENDTQNGSVGWTGYTGAAAWTDRIFREFLLGMKFRDGNKLIIDPCIPKDKETFSYMHKRGNGGPILNITVNNPHHVSTGVKTITINGVPCDSKIIEIDKLKAGQDYTIVVTMG